MFGFLTSVLHVLTVYMCPTATVGSATPESASHAVTQPMPG